MLSALPPHQNRRKITESQLHLLRCENSIGCAGRGKNTGSVGSSCVDTVALHILSSNRLLDGLQCSYGMLNRLNCLDSAWDLDLMNSLLGSWDLDGMLKKCVTTFKSSVKATRKI